MEQTNKIFIEPKKECYEKSFFHSKWRPAMGWSYLLVCLFDVVAAPIYFTIIQDPSNLVQWKPMTIQGGGLYHMSMLAIVGVTAWGRTQEKIKLNDSFGDEMEFERETERFETIPVPPKPRRSRKTA